MRRETVITAAVFLMVGFLAGYIAHAQLNADAKRAVPTNDDQALGRLAPSGASSEGSPPGLPEGHPSLEVAGQMRALEDQALKNPTDPKPRLALANLFYDNRRYERAIEWYQRGLELDPRNVSARTDLGTAYFYSGRFEDALREYRHSLETEPNHGPTLYNMVIVNLEGTHDLAAAQQAWEHLRRQNPNYPGLDELKEKLDAARASSGSAPARR